MTLKIEERLLTQKTPKRDPRGPLFHLFWSRINVGEPKNPENGGKKSFFDPAVFERFFSTRKNLKKPAKA